MSDRKPLGALIMGIMAKGKKPAAEEPKPEKSSEGDEDQEARKEAGQAVLDAIEAKDPLAVYDSLEAVVHTCSMGEDDYEGDEELADMRGVTYQELLTRAREEANMEGEDTFMPDARVLKMVGEACAKAYDLVINCWGQDYYRRTAELNVTSGQYLYPLPADFYKLLVLHANCSAVMGTPSSVWAPPSSPSLGVTGWMQLESFMPSELTALLGARSATPGMAYYRLAGNPEDLDTPVGQQIELRPTPNAVWTLRMDYIPVYRQTPDDDATLAVFDGINGWDDWVSLHVARKLLRKEESSVSDIDAEIAEARARIQDSAPTRDAGRSERWTDVQGSGYGYGGGYGYSDPLATVVSPWRR